MDVLRLPIRIKAKDKVMKFDVVLNPIFFSFYKGFEVKVIEGPLSGSIFCCKISDFEYNLYGKFQIWILWKVYWIRNVFWRHLRYYYPYQVKMFFKRNKNKSKDLECGDDLPF